MDTLLVALMLICPLTLTNSNLFRFLYHAHFLCKNCRTSIHCQIMQDPDLHRDFYHHIEHHSYSDSVLFHQGYLELHCSLQILCCQGKESGPVHLGYFADS